jgi:hypothetical protein
MLAQAVPVTAFGILRVDEKPEAGPRKVQDSHLGTMFSCGDDEDPGHVVGAVTVASPRLAVSGVLEGASIVGH